MLGIVLNNLILVGGIVFFGWSPPEVAFSNLREGKNRVVLHQIRYDHLTYDASELVYGSACETPSCPSSTQWCKNLEAEPNLLDSRGCPLLPCGVRECVR